MAPHRAGWRQRRRARRARARSLDPQQRLAPQPSLDWTLENFPLASLQPWLPDDFAWQGQLDGQLKVELPDSGRIMRKMSCSWPIGFNGGFQGSLTGYDNARFIARIYGKSYAEIKEFVADFTELGQSLTLPVKTYSSGMRARLAFALSLAIEFDCYLIDEVILVGDVNFQRKCQHELFEKRADRAMIIVSHDMNVVRDVCNRGVVIHEGRARHYADVHEAAAFYEEL